MCRMLGIVSTQPIPLGLLMQFRMQADTGKTASDFGCKPPTSKIGHPDGWGLSCISENEDIYVRSARKATEDALFEETAKRVSRLSDPPFLLLLHVRRAGNPDTISEEFSHPFRKEIDGRVVLFGHNGEIQGFGVQGRRIDSQFIFERLVAEMDGDHAEPKKLRDRLQVAIQKLDAEFPRRISSITFLMIDGDRMIAHREARSCVQYYTLHCTRRPNMHLFSSEVLPNLPGSWHLLRNGSYEIVDKELREY